MYTADVIADSLNSVTGNRITTFRVVMPRSALAEIVTHRILFVDDTLDAALPEATRAGNLVGWKSLRKVEFALEESGGDVRT